MSKRLQPGYSESLAAMYGKRDKIGDAGEKQCMHQLSSCGITVKRVAVPTFPLSTVQTLQNAGIDILIGDDIVALDVKNNVVNQQFFVETGKGGWLFNPKNQSDLIIHTSKTNHNLCYWYTRDTGQQNVVQTQYKMDIFPIHTQKLPLWVNTGWDTLIEYIKLLELK